MQVTERQKDPEGIPSTAGMNHRSLFTDCSKAKEKLSC